MTTLNGQKLNRNDRTAARGEAITRLRTAGKSYSEIADELGITSGLVSYYLSKPSKPSKPRKPRKKRIRRSQRAPIGTPGRLEALKAAALEYARPIVLAEVLQVTMSRKR
jgi:predicted transcriptional regulator